MRTYTPLKKSGVKLLKKRYQKLPLATTKKALKIERHKL
jgi:hypothetical protein